MDGKRIDYFAKPRRKRLNAQGMRARLNRGRENFARFAISSYPYTKRPMANAHIRSARFATTILQILGLQVKAQERAGVHISLYTRS